MCFFLLHDRGRYKAEFIIQGWRLWAQGMMDECIYVALEVETEGKYSLITTCALEAFVFVCFHPLFYSLYAFSLLSDLLIFSGLWPLRTGSPRDSCDPPLAGISKRPSKQKTSCHLFRLIVYPPSFVSSNAFPFLHYSVIGMYMHL